MLRRMARGMRDGAIAMALRAWINDRYGEFGRVTDLNLDISKGTLHAIVELNGEAEPISARIDRFTLHEEDGQHYVLIHAVSASRDWIGRVLNRLGAGRRVTLPGSVGKLL